MHIRKVAYGSDFTVFIPHVYTEVSGVENIGQCGRLTQLAFGAL